MKSNLFAIVIALFSIKKCDLTYFEPCYDGDFQEYKGFADPHRFPRNNS